MKLKRAVEFLTCILLGIMVLTTAASAVAVVSSDNLVTVPSSGISNYVYTVSGSGFAINAQVWVRSPTGVTYQVTETAWAIAGTYIRGYLTIPSSAAAGSYSVYVQNPGATAVYRTGMFTKSGSTPASISTFSPNYATRGVSKTVYVYGSNFQPGAQVIIYKGGATALQATGETFINSNTIRCVIYVSTSQPNGYYYGGVINPGMGFYPKSNAFYLY